PPARRAPPSFPTRRSSDLIGATSLRAIAADAEVTPAMLHYYFGDKEQLKQALIEERLLPTMEPIRERLVRLGDDPAAMVGAFVQDRKSTRLNSSHVSTSYA